MRDEELRTLGIPSGARHSNGTPLVRVWRRLCPHRISGTSPSISPRIAPLHDEVRNDTMKSQAVKES